MIYTTKLSICTFDSIVSCTRLYKQYIIIYTLLLTLAVPAWSNNEVLELLDRHHSDHEILPCYQKVLSWGQAIPGLFDHQAIADD